MRNLPDGSGCCDRMGPMVCSKRFAVSVTGPFSVKIADPILRSSKITGCCKKVGGDWLTLKKKKRKKKKGKKRGGHLFLVFMVWFFDMSWVFNW